MNLQEEGRLLLESTQLESILRNFGTVTTGGSYSYDLLVDRDIDMDVRIPEGGELTLELRAEFGAALLREVRTMRGLEVADVYHFPKGAKHQIDGIWYGLSVISEHSGERWSVDIWLLLHNSRTEVDSILSERLMNLTTEEREVIMTLKQEALSRKVKEKGVTSTRIYEAVLQRGATTLDGVLEDC